jgi:hypothetical protein
LDLAEKQVLLFDSLWGLGGDPLGLERMVELQICKIYGKYTGDTVKVKKVAVQQQLPGTEDCGLFAVAYATDICYGKDPGKARFDQTMMKNHFKDCLERGSIHPFPQKSKKVPKPSSPVDINIEVFCMCKMPESYDQSMVQCDTCDGWYHKSCVGISHTRRMKGIEWKCKACTYEDIPQLVPKPQEFRSKFPANRSQKLLCLKLSSFQYLLSFYTHVLAGFLCKFFGFCFAFYCCIPLSNSLLML